ncbi:MAG TPA: phosphoribosylanthranilate isomerase [Planctomycetaceae bacterium]|jgi:phosphoribosylanthranilate isomerase|nr:phosphoribosylanthranilate isomerase [Planctomycetaceae bacterium]
MWIKICGIRDYETAEAVAECGPQAIGLNFYEKSPRFVAPQLATEIVVRLPREVEPVGVFVNHSVDEIQTICRRCDIGIVQLHGDEPPEVVAALSQFRVIRAFRVGAEGLGEITSYLQRCRRLDTLPWACLVDARVEGTYGGTGQAAPWELIRRDYNFAGWPPLILAGGLQPDNVSAAIKAVRPWGVDVAGGVESAVACKDISLVRKFVESARNAALSQ